MKEDSEKIKSGDSPFSAMKQALIPFSLRRNLFLNLANKFVREKGEETKDEKEQDPMFNLAYHGSTPWSVSELTPVC